jgi:hypothetical protein
MSGEPVPSGKGDVGMKDVLEWPGGDVEISSSSHDAVVFVLRDLCKDNTQVTGPALMI